MSSTLKVSDLPASITEEKLHDFFGVSGKILSIDHSKEVAVIHYEPSTDVAGIAQMLDGSKLDDAIIHVTAEGAGIETSPHEGSPIGHSDKPKAGVAAEYLAKGYSLGDHILERAINIDAKRGISKRFLEYFHSLDSGLGKRALGPDQTLSGKVQETVKTVTEQAEQKGYTKMATEYYTKAIHSPWGEKVRAFYTTTAKQIQDIHDEALRIKELNKPEAQKSTEEK